MGKNSYRVFGRAATLAYNRSNHGITGAGLAFNGFPDVRLRWGIWRDGLADTRISRAAVRQMAAPLGSISVHFAEKCPVDAAFRRGLIFSA